SVVAVWRNVTETLTSLMARRALLDRLLAHERLPALGGRKDAHGLAVFGHRAPGDFDRVGGQHRGDMLVAERLAQIFAGDDAADLFLDAFAGDVLAVAAAQAALKKEFQLKQPLRRVHVFVRGRAAHGGLVHVDVFGHVAQHHRLESAHAALKKFSSNSPCGVCTYLFAVARLTVDSCMLMSSATSRSTIGLRALTPRSRNSC